MCSCFTKASIWEYCKLGFRICSSYCEADLIMIMLSSNPRHDNHQLHEYESLTVQTLMLAPSEGEKFYCSVACCDVILLSSFWCHEIVNVRLCTLTEGRKNSGLDKPSCRQE